MSWLDDSQGGIKIAWRNTKNFRYAADTTLMAESKEELKSLLMRVREESEKAGLKLNIQKTKTIQAAAQNSPGWRPRRLDSPGRSRRAKRSRGLAGVGVARGVGDRAPPGPRCSPRMRPQYFPYMIGPHGWRRPGAWEDYENVWGEMGPGTRGLGGWGRQ